MKHGRRLSTMMLTIAVGATWPKVRVLEQTSAITDGKCPRCQAARETPFHRTWECAANQKCP
eukprot:8811867-Pyramimonas_sp.AAC.1